MPDKVIDLLGKLPFLLLVQDGGVKQIRANYARITELLVAVVAIIWYLSHSLSQIEVKIDNMNKDLSKLDNRLYEHLTKGSKMERPIDRSIIDREYIYE